MKISILASDLSDNSLGRAYLLGKVLMRRFEVEIIGPAFRSRIWYPCRTGEIKYKIVPGHSSPAFWWDAKRILNLIQGDVVYAMKPLLTSFGVGIIAKLNRKLPLILDIDDWEVGSYRSRNKLRLLWRLFSDLRKPLYSYPYALLTERLIGFADSITTSSRFLERKFGGVVVPHGRDTELFDPQKYDREKLRRREGLNGEKVIMFLGSPRRHKGIEDLIEAVRRLKQRDAKLLIVGCDFGDPYTDRLARIGEGVVVLIGMVPFSKIPEFLSIADIVVVPQRNDPYCKAQVPAKIFDAMAMAKPVISTRVSDIPEILNGAGLIVESSDVSGIYEAISYLIADERARLELGRKARERCVREYSWDKIEEVLCRVLDRFV